MASGSTIVTLKAAYLETLAVGKHTIGVVSENGTAEADFTVVKSAAKPGPNKQTPPDKGEDTKIPRTGDNSHLFLWLVLLALSGSKIAVIGIRKKKTLPAGD